MDIRLPETIDREEWLKFLHIKGEPDRSTADSMEEAEALLLAAAVPRGIWRAVPRSRIPVQGISIEKHLEGCDQAAVMAVTIGARIDQLITRTQITSMKMAVMLDSGASVLAEQVTERAEEILRAELAQKLPGTYATSRFSPGYGDYPLSVQRQILACVDAQRKIGITLTSAGMMIPHKSVTAVLGLADHPVTGRQAPCAECLLRSKCPFLREGGHC